MINQTAYFCIHLFCIHRYYSNNKINKIEMLFIYLQLSIDNIDNLIDIYKPYQKCKQEVN